MSLQWPRFGAEEASVARLDLEATQLAETRSKAQLLITRTMLTAGVKKEARLAKTS